MPFGNEILGFLPTFGPDFVHLYADNVESTYSGKLLIGVDTEILHIIKERGPANIVNLQTTSPSEVCIANIQGLLQN